MYMCLYVFEREKKTGTEKWVEVCGKPWCRLVFVWLGLHSRGYVPVAPLSWALVGQHFVIGLR